MSLLLLSSDASECLLVENKMPFMKVKVTACQDIDVQVVTLVFYEFGLK